MTVDPRGPALPPALASQFRANVPRFAGQSSVMYDAVDPASGHPVLLKVLRESVVTSPAERQRIVRELQKLVQVRHAALPVILAAGEASGLVWIVRPAIEGTSLSERLAAGPLAVSDAARIAGQLASALGELHRNGVLHRDVRPGHVVLEPNGGVKLIDASVARVYAMPDGRAGTGTPGYVAPEAIAGKLVSFRSDLYSLGATLFEMLMGAPPYGPPDAPDVLARQIEQDAPPVTVPVPPALAKLVASLLSREPRERPFSAQQLERQLEPLAFAVQAARPKPERTMMAIDPPVDDGEDDATMMLDPSGPKPITASHAAPAPSRDGEFDEMPTRAGESPFAAAPGPSPAGAAGTAGRPTPSVRKATLMGFAPGAIPSSAVRSAPPAPSTGAQPLPGARPHEANDFEDRLDTVVQEDSMVFGIPPVGAHTANASGSAVPPLPDGFAQRVLTGSVRPPPPESPAAMQASHPFQNKVPSNPFIQNVPVNRPPSVDPQEAFASTMLAPSPLENGATMGQGPPPQAPHAQGPQGYPGPPQGPGMQPYPGVPQGYPGAQGYGPPGAPPQPYPAGPPQGDPPGQLPMGGYPGQPPLMGAPMEAPAPVAKKRSALPWIFAGIAVAATAGGLGYYVTIRHRMVDVPPVVVAPPFVPPHPVVSVPPIVPPPPVPTVVAPVPAVVAAPTPPVVPTPAPIVPAPTPPVPTTTPVVAAPTPTPPTPVVAPTPSPSPAPSPTTVATPAPTPAHPHHDSTPPHHASSHPAPTHATHTAPTHTAPAHTAPSHSGPARPGTVRPSGTMRPGSIRPH